MTKQRPATIHDIARLAGVSPSTVSRVLNATTPVAEEKRAAVLAAIAGLNFRPNVVAQGLARRRSMTVGVLTQDIASPFYGEILKGIEQGLHGSLYQPVFASGNWRAAEEQEALQVLIERQIDALIILGGQLPDSQLRTTAGTLPLVVVGRTIPGLEQSSLNIDHLQGAYAATRYLLELGHQRIAHITGLLSHSDAVERRGGYLRALDHAGIPTDARLIVEGDYSEQSGLLAVETLFSRGVRFTALFAANDQTAYGARLALFRRGVRVPDDVSLVGFDDQPGSAYTTPPLTTVRQPTSEMGAAAAHAVLQLLAGATSSLPLFETRLVARESAGLRR